MLTHVIHGATEDLAIHHGGGTLWVRVEIGKVRGTSKVFASQDGEAFEVKRLASGYEIAHAGETMQFRVTWPSQRRAHRLPRIEIQAEQSWRIEWSRKAESVPNA